VGNAGPLITGLSCSHIILNLDHLLRSLVTGHAGLVLFLLTGPALQDRSG